MAVVRLRGGSRALSLHWGCRREGSAVKSHTNHLALSRDKRRPRADVLQTTCKALFAATDKGDTYSPISRTSSS